MSENAVIVEKKAPIATVILNRPERRNTFTFQLLRSLEDTFKKMQNDENIRVVILRGAGKEAFCSGYDLRFDEEIDWETVGSFLFPALSFRECWALYWLVSTLRVFQFFGILLSFIWPLLKQ